MRRLAASIRKYSRRIVAGGSPLGAGGQPDLQAARVPCQTRQVGHFGKSRRGIPERVARRPHPVQWSEDELLALHEAVALLWPGGPVTVSSLRTAIAAGDLAHARIAGRIFTTRAALAEMAACRRTAAADGGAAGREDADWAAHLATLLPKRGGRSGKAGPGHRG
ncbi:MAG: hypothetical protein QOJ84_1754 [Bradyrhizobium sp.]|jgi:hypothetical protein|nr:hypothetical protein [Bradyrhizobium sp.]